MVVIVPNRARTFRRAASAIAVISLLVATNDPAAAQTADTAPQPTTTTPTPDPDPPIPHRYQGAFWGLQAHVGMVYRLAARAGDLPGPAVAVSGRVASLLSIADFQINVQGSMYGAQSSRGEEIAVRRLSVGVEAHLHPLFLQHLENDNFWFWAAGIYVALGVALEVTDLDGAGQNRTELDAGWHLGGGMDYPLTDVHAGWSLWLGAAYKLRFLSVASGIGGLGSFSEHTLLITLGYRNNDIFGLRVPQPTEFDYRDPAVPE